MAYWHRRVDRHAPPPMLALRAAGVADAPRLLAELRELADHHQNAENQCGDSGFVRVVVELPFTVYQRLDADPDGDGFFQRFREGASKTGILVEWWLTD